MPEPLRKLITVYKFGGRVRLARCFATFLAETIERSFPGVAVVPVPPRPRRQGPDAVERIARLLERQWGFPVHRCLSRTGGVQQKSLDFASRAENLRGRISVRSAPGSHPVPSRAVLLDDVFTTGATADACARALAAAGCEPVWSVTLAVD